MLGRKTRKTRKLIFRLVYFDVALYICIAYWGVLRCHPGEFPNHKSVPTDTVEHVSALAFLIEYQLLYWYGEVLLLM